MKRYFGFLFFCLLAGQILSQNYLDYPPNQKKEIFREEFTRDLRNLRVEGKEDNYNHKKGIMYGHDVLLTSRIARSFSSLGNFEYELYIRQTPEINFTLSWYTAFEHEEKPSKLDFNCSNEEISLIGRGAKKNQDIHLLAAGPEYQKFIEADSFNKITLRRIDTIYQLFINEMYVGKLEYPYKGGQAFRFESKKQNFELDYFTLNKLLNEPEIVEEVLVSRTIDPVKKEFDAESIEKNYYALIIGNNNYTDPNLADLDQPISDAGNLYKVLTGKYTFDLDNVVFLKDATRKDIIVELDKFSNQLTENDNFLIFYAGHGYWDEKKEQGYWFPVDAEKDVTADWLRNSTIQGYIESIKAKHTLLIADACFGGGIFKSRAAFPDASKSINNLYRYDSRKAMTSGMLNEVPDKSVFMENLVARLNNNNEKYLPSMNLFMQFRENVMNNSYNAPQYGTIHNTGDQGGDFIFILKTK